MCWSEKHSENSRNIYPYTDDSCDENSERKEQPNENSLGYFSKININDNISFQENLHVPQDPFVDKIPVAWDRISIFWPIKNQYILGTVDSINNSGQHVVQ